MKNFDKNNKTIRNVGLLVLKSSHEINTVYMLSEMVQV